MKKKSGERSYRRNDMRDKEWEKIKDYIKEKKGRGKKWYKFFKRSILDIEGRIFVNGLTDE